jgi:hypothetical protein
MDSELDCSWIEEEELLYMDIKERENMDSIRCYFIYIAADSTILKVIKENEILSPIVSDNSTIDSNKKGIQNDRLLHIIQNKRSLDSGQRFKISSLVKYVVDIEASGLSLFSSLHKHDLRDSGFLKEVNIFGDVIIEPSIFCFHSVASLYFFLREDEMIIKPVRSILKVNKSNNQRATKKVRIFEDISENIIIDDLATRNKQNKTKKVR